jgi:hypothetical protein
MLVGAARKLKRGLVVVVVVDEDVEEETEAEEEAEELVEGAGSFETRGVGEGEVADGEDVEDGALSFEPEVEEGAGMMDLMAVGATSPEGGANLDSEGFLSVVDVGAMKEGSLES